MSRVSDLKYKCDQCGMVFTSNDHLFKHKTRFCVGVKDSGIGRKPVYSDDEDNHDATRNPAYVPRSTRTHVDRHQSLNRPRRDEASDWTQHTGQRRILHDLRDQMMTNTYRTGRQLENYGQQEQTYQEILLEYERIQAQERDILREMYNLNPDPLTSNRGTNATDRLRERLEDLQRRNQRLEQERRIIQEKLEELLSNNYQPSHLSNHDPRRFLIEMKRQQDLNEKAMEFLRQRLMFPTSDIPSLPQITSRAGKSGAENARDLRNNYLQAGGHDANLLAHYTDIEYQLRTYENFPWTKDYPEPLKPAPYQASTNPPRLDPTTEQMKLSNDENLLLQAELEEMQQKFNQLDQRTRQLEASLATLSPSESREVSLNRTQRYPMTNDYMADQIPERDQMYPPPRTSQTLAPSLEKRITPRASPAMTLLASSVNNLRDPLAPQSYDPRIGFVIFFDFILHLPPNVTQSCLITCLHHPKSGLGEPSQLENFKCEPYVDDRNGQRMSVAFIAMKQPVPRCPPQQALTVVLEVQTTTKQQNVTSDDLKTEAWAKFPLFDQKNRVLSGRWKVPLLALPIQHEESLAVASTFPTFGHAELYYRLVNGQDGDEQSNASISPNMRDLYAYPPQYRNRSMM